MAGKPIENHQAMIRLEDVCMIKCMLHTLRFDIIHMINIFPPRAWMAFVSIA